MGGKYLIDSLKIRDRGKGKEIDEFLGRKGGGCYWCCPEDGNGAVKSHSTWGGG